MTPEQAGCVIAITMLWAGTIAFLIGFGIGWLVFS